MRCCVRRVSDKQVNLKHPDFIATSNGLYMHSAAYIIYLGGLYKKKKKKAATKRTAEGIGLVSFISAIVRRHMTHLRNK